MDKYLISCQTFIFPTHESVHHHKLPIYIAMAGFGELCTKGVGTPDTGE